MHNTNRRGFTLLELLAVVALIVIAVAIVWPAFAKVGEKSRHSSCIANEKQIVLAILQYAQDYDEVLPQLAITTNAVGKVPSSVKMYTVVPSNFSKLDYYLKDARVLSCPADSDDNRPFIGIDIYGLRRVVQPSYGLRAESSGLSLGLVTDPQRDPILIDLGKYPLWTATDTKAWPIGFPSVVKLFAGDRMIETSVDHYGEQKLHNIGFLDGHVKTWRSADIVDAAFSSGNPLGSDPKALQKPAKEVKAEAEPQSKTVTVKAKATVVIDVGTVVLTPGTPFQLRNTGGKIVYSGTVPKK